MNQKHDPDAALDQALAGIRDEAIDPAVIEKAAARVLARLSQEASPAPVAASPDRIRTCADVQSLIGPYLAGTLPAARTLLMEDHTRECIPCRRALLDARSGGAARVRSSVAESTARPRVLRWAIAASILGTVILGGYAAYWYAPADPSVSAVRVQTIEGALYRVSGNLSTSVREAEEIAGGDVFRTAKGSRAVVRLSDGSRVEMNERAELSVSARRAGTTLHLTRGSIIVEAAKQGRRHLYVDTTDCAVAVTGTVFSVNHGTKGSRVSVIEGEVHVDLSGMRSVLGPGDQVCSGSLEKVPLSSEIAWSKNVDQHLAMLAALTQLKREIDALPHAGLRHDTRLLDLAPEDTLFYVAIPNVSETLGEAHRLLRARVKENPVLRNWWEQTMTPGGADARLDAAIGEIRAFGDQLGPEIAATVVAGASGEPEGVLLLATLTHPSEFRPFVESRIEGLRASQGANANVRFVDDPSGVVPETSETLLLWSHDDLLVATTSPAHLREIAGVVAGERPNRFAESPFHADLVRSYRDGTTWLMGVDLQRIFSAAGRTRPDQETLRRAGILDARNLIIEGKEIEGKTTYQAVVAFDQPRRGVASWLAAPAPMGSLEFVSPDATLATAFVTKSPVALARDVFDLASASDPDFARHLADFETQHGVSVLEDLAQPLGGEFAFALDGPVLPKPGWVLIVEVYDSTRLQHTIERAVAELNRQGGDGTGPELALGEEVAGGRTYRVLRSGRFPVEVHYTFADGFLVAAPARSLVDAAIARRATGANLPASSRFTALLPADGNMNFSAVAYQNLGPALAPLAGILGAPQGEANSEQKQALAALLGEQAAGLAYAYGEENRIVVASTRPGGMFGSDLGVLVGLGGLMDLQGNLERAMKPPQAIVPVEAPGAP